MILQNDKVYRAAREFAMHGSEETIKEILLDIIDFDEESVDEIISMIQFHKDDIDGGYTAFIKAVNKSLGKNIYCVECDYKKVKNSKKCNL